MVRKELDHEYSLTNPIEAHSINQWGQLLAVPASARAFRELRVQQVQIALMPVVHLVERLAKIMVLGFVSREAWIQ